MKNVTIIGAGNGGMTTAYHLSKNNFNVCIYDSENFSTQIKAINESGGIKALDEEHGCSMILGGYEKIALATTNVKQAVNFSDVLIMVCPSFAQEIFFNDMLPYLKTGQTIVLMPGNYGGLALNKIKNNSIYKELDINFVDAISIPWACRIVEPGVITIMGIKEFLPVSIHCENKDANKEEIKNIIKDVMPIRLEFLQNPIIAGLENINFGGHPLLTVLNMGLLENFNGNFNYYRDCCSTATANVAKKMDIERLSVGKAYGFSLRTELDAMNSLYNSNYETVYDFNRDSVTHIKINSAPSSSQDRYISEDVPYLLVPCYWLAKKANINVPIIESCIHIACAYNDEDYFTTGRTLEKMGIGNLSMEEIIAKFS